LILATKLLEWCDFKQLDFRGRSGTRKDLRNWLIQSYMSIGVNTASHANIDAGEKSMGLVTLPPPLSLPFSHNALRSYLIGHMINCLNNQVEEAVVKGWYMLFKIIEAVFGLIFSVIVVLLLTTNEKTGHVQWGLALPIFPSVALALAATSLREKENVKLVRHRAQKEDDWVGLANEVLIQSDAIKAFRKEEVVAKEFKEEYEVFYTVHRRHRKFEMGTDWVCHWYNGIVYYSILAFGPIAIVNHLTAAKFVVLVKLYRSIDKYTRLLSASISNMQRASIAMDEIREILNLPSQGHEVGALGKTPEFKGDEDEVWSMNEIISLVTFIFLNNKDPHAHAPPESILAMAEKAKLATKVIGSTTVGTLGVVGKVGLSGVGLLGGKSMSFKRGASSRSMELDDEDVAVAKSAMSRAKVVPEQDPEAPIEDLNPSDDGGMAHGTAALYHWVFNESNLDVFDHVTFHEATMSVKKPGDSHGAVVVNKLTLNIPLGRFYVITGNLKQIGKGIGRGVFLETLCGMRLVDSGYVGIPPHVKTIMLTENYNLLFNKTLEDSLLWGNPNAATITEETVLSACRIAGLDERFTKDFKEARSHRKSECSCLKEDDPHRPGHKRVMCRFKVGKNGQKLRVVVRASVMIARALLADVDILILNRAEGAFGDAKRNEIYANLQTWVKDGLAGSEKLMAGVPRLRTVFLSSYNNELPQESTHELRLGAGANEDSIEINEMTSELRLSRRSSSLTSQLSS